MTSIFSVATWVVGIAALAVVIANVSALGWLPGTSASETCVDAGDAVTALEPGAVVSAGGTSVCVEHPVAMQRLADLGDQLPQVVFEFGALFLVLRFLRTASREGPYAAAVPGRLSAAGWFVLIGGPLSGLLATLSQAYLRSTMLADARPGWFGEWMNAFPGWAVGTGVAALTFAYILRIGVGMREDLEGTV
ncbi:DUF2975 domain-containing protein [Amycolatopsis panacis]|uniref:DUF2975 domain-containing protein n=1 Tax=Amycolatopsis panacis TaxID=2340917 RepID=A0A419IA47_9PSEU|nr:DUF2975 domain-containing protein [Amycolatopsis panacis]RJQ90026.1 DUF2975 domain-containing protein [Amycolatopsis panacis]